MSDSIVMAYITTIIILLINCFFQVGSALGVTEHLDEVINRKERMGNISWGPSLLENKNTNYTWQPETIAYSEQINGNEVWRLTYTPTGLIGGKTHDISNTHWSSNGHRLLIHSFRGSSAFAPYGIVNYNGSSYKAIAGGIGKIPSSSAYWLRIPYDSSYPYWKPTTWYESQGALWVFVNSDGSRMRAATNAASRYTNWDPYPLPSPVYPDVFYQGGRYDGKGLKNNGFYKITVSDQSIDRKLLLTLPESVRRMSLKKAISGDGSTVVVSASGKFFPLIVFPEIESKLLVQNGYKNKLNFDYYWGKTPSPSWSGYHDQYLSGAKDGIDGIWNFLMPENTNGSWWRARISGSGADGAPVHIASRTPPYQWGEEVEPVETTSGQSLRDPWCPGGTVPNTDCVEYISHFTPDRWAHYGISSKSANSPYGSSIYDLRNHKYKVIAFESVPLAQHHDWSAWSDWSVSSANLTAPIILKDQVITTQNYKSRSQKILSGVHTHYNGSPKHPYESNARPTQSPDGTKVLFNSTFLNATDSDIQLYWVVAYYPYPPEIKSASKDADRVRLVWDFNQGASGAVNLIDPRTYATRGWPHEMNSRPPAPREIDKFRIWASIDNISWVPVGITTYNNCRGKNECGTWTETSWSYNIAQPQNSTFYYAITSLEYSGLESRTLSNVWKVALDSSGNITQQNQQSIYPANPGDKSSFYTTPPPAIKAQFKHKGSPATANGQYLIKWDAPPGASMIRYYNVYAKDGAPPFTNATPVTDRQKTRIASIPASSDYDATGTYSYIDWLGDAGGSTQYIVTAVDFQGNETRYIAPPP